MEGHSEKRPVSLFSIAFLKAYWITLRPYLFFVSGVAGFLGIALIPEVPPYKMILGFLAFFFSYGLGQAITDVTQTDTDAISSPYRPLVQGIITKRQVFGVSMVGLTMCLVFLLVMNLWIIIPGIIAVIGINTYTPLKRRWWGGPFWNSWIVATLTVMGKMVHRFDLATHFDVNLVLGIVSVLFSYAVFVLTGYLKDVQADRQTNYQTFVVRFGWKPCIYYSMAHAAVATAASFFLLCRGGVFAFTGMSSILAAIIWLAGVALFLVAHLQLLRVSTEVEAHPGIANVVRAFMLMHISESLVFKPELLLFGVLFYLIFEVALYFRPEKSQI